MYTFGSLFAGIGGIDLGFERAGLECKWQVEIDDYATKVLEKHWPDVSRWRDVKTFPPEDNQDWNVDVIAGGFPCQDISFAGKGEGLHGERSGLFFEIIRLARQLKPKAIVLENVSALLARGMGTVLAELAQVGYDSEWHCIPACSVGAPHIRNRVFIVSELADSSSERQSRQRLHGGRFSQKKNQDGKANWFIDSSERKENNWHVEPNVGRVANGVPDRMDRLKCLGNAVVPQVAEIVGNMVIDKLERMRK
jgi:DNA (cytosine-5)-methyltransferase 1